MSVVSHHPDYDIYLPVWQKIRDTLAGSRVVKDKGTTYLPALSGQTDAEYVAYKTRANYVNLSAKVLQSLVGQMTKRPPITENVPDEYVNSLTNHGESIYESTAVLSEELIAFGRVGLFVDFVANRARVSMFKTEDIVDWYYDTLTATLMMVTLRESLREGNDYIDVYYKLYINDDGVYAVDTFFDNDTDVITRIPTKDGAPMRDIPFYMLTPKGMKFNIEKAPFEDIAEINLSHYRTSADLEQGRHFVALPTPVVSGVSEDSEMRIGSTTAWVLPDKDARAYYLEFQGQGLTSLERALSEKQSQIAMFSARIIESTTRGSEAAETVRLRYASEAATLAGMASVIERALNKVVEKVLWWSEDLTGSSVTIVKDFLSTKLTAAEITSITNSYLEGAIDRETFINYLVRGDVIAAHRANEEIDREVVLQQDVEREAVRVGSYDDIEDPQDRTV